MLSAQFEIQEFDLGPSAVMVGVLTTLQLTVRID